MTINSLLPPNASPLERALEHGLERISDVPTPLAELWNPATCPVDLLPWLAWALSTDRWEIHWTEARKRAAVASSIDDQRNKGTPASVEAVLKSFDELLTLTEWFEMRPPGAPHTFTIDLPLALENGETGGFRSSAEFAEAIIRDVNRTKPVRSHFKLLQTLVAEARVRVLAWGQVAGFVRLESDADTTIEPEWATYLQTEQGEPLETEGGAFIQEANL